MCVCLMKEVVRVSDEIVERNPRRKGHGRSTRMTRTLHAHEEGCQGPQESAVPECRQPRAQDLWLGVQRW